jgi:AcrR family transcriptional regulator
MVKPAASPKPARKKRGQGRPIPGENDVGRERLLDATETLLRSFAPSRVTIARVAREAHVDTALVHYYFGNRTALLLAVIERVTGHEVQSARTTDDPVVELADHIRRTVRFVRSASFMHRLVIEELAQAGTEASRARVRTMNLDLVNFYRELLRGDRGRELVSTDPLLLHLTVLGASDFFASAQPLIRELVPVGTDMEKLTARFQKFLVTLILDGLRKR